MDWFFGIDMGIYHTTVISTSVHVVPDGFLSLGVPRKKDGESRRSYAVWEENEVVPILTLEIVSHTPGAEYDQKLDIYAKLGVLYYVIYNPLYWYRDQHQPFEVYKLVGKSYQLQIGEPYWMPEVGLGIKRYRGIFAGIQQELLCWYSEQGNRYLTADENAFYQQQRAEKLAQYLRSIGVDPDNLPGNYSNCKNYIYVETRLNRVSTMYGYQSNSSLFLCVSVVKNKYGDCTGETPVLQGEKKARYYRALVYLT